MKRRFLVVSPHPDDAELGIGGLIIKLKKQGHRVFVVDLTTGEPTPYGSQEKRKRESINSAKILGLDARDNLGLENRFLFDNREARLMLAEKIRLYRPEAIFCPYPEDAHPDHLSSSRIVEAARFYAKFTKIHLRGRPHYPFYLFYYFCAHLRVLPKISFLVDISDVFEEKMKAIRCYRSQFLDNPKGRFVFEYIEAQNRYLGMLIGTKYAEPLYSKEALRIKDLARALLE